MTFPDADTERNEQRLRAFRRAAAQANAVLLRFKEQKFSVRFGVPDTPDELSGLPEDTFVRLTANVRLVYLNSQGAHFNRVCNIVHSRLKPSLRPSLRIVRENWKNTLGRGVVFQDVRDSSAISLSIKHALDSLLNGEIFHQDAERQDAARFIRELGGLSTVVLQQEVWSLAQTMVQLDAFVAHVLDEPALEGTEPLVDWLRRQA